MITVTEHVYSQKIFQPKDKSSPKKVKVQNFRSSLTITKREFNSNAFTAKQSAALASILPSVIETGITLVKSELKKREESFTAEYSAKVSEGGFWKNSKKLNLPELKYERSFDSKKESNKHMLSFDLIPEQSTDGLAFRYKISSLKIDWSQARITKRKSSLNLELDIKISAFVQGEKEYAKKELGENSIILEGLKFGNNINLNKFSGWFPIIKQVKGTSNPNGNYEIEISIKEANPGVLKTQKMLQFFEDNGEKLQEASKVIIENIFKEEDKSNEEDKEGEGDGNSNGEGSDSE